MKNESYIGWVRDEKGKVLSRPVKHIANAVTTMVGGGGIQARTDLVILLRISLSLLSD